MLSNLYRKLYRKLYRGSTWVGRIEFGTQEHQEVGAPLRVGFQRPTTNIQQPTPKVCKGFAKFVLVLSETVLVLVIER